MIRAALWKRDGSGAAFSVILKWNMHRNFVVYDGESPEG